MTVEIVYDEKQEQRCEHCGGPVGHAVHKGWGPHYTTPRRYGVKYCSVRCRVAAHRARRAAEQKSKDAAAKKKAAQRRAAKKTTPKKKTAKKTTRSRASKKKGGRR